MLTRLLIRIMSAVPAAAALLVVGCASNTGAPNDKMIVAASIAPLADFAEKVGGDLVEVELLVPPGASPHTFQLTAEQMKTLANASVLVLNGVGLEYWADKAVDAAGNPNLIVVNTADGLDLIEKGDTEHGEGGNPHVWLSPKLAIRQVQAIRDAFVEADPQHESIYAANTGRFIEKLEALDADIRKQIGSFSNKSFIAFHPAWAYFARDYGLVQAAVIEESPGVEPSPSDVTDVVKTAKRIKAKAIFTEPQFSPKAAQVIAQESGARVLVLDPLGTPDNHDYIELMRSNVARIAEGLE